MAENESQNTEAILARLKAMAFQIGQTQSPAGKDSITNIDAMQTPPLFKSVESVVAAGLDKTNRSSTGIPDNLVPPVEFKSQPQIPTTDNSMQSLPLFPEDGTVDNVLGYYAKDGGGWRQWGKFPLFATQLAAPGWMAGTWQAVIPASTAQHVYCAMGSNIYWEEVDECEDNNVAHTNTTNTFTEPQTATNGTNSVVLAGTSGAIRTNVTSTGSTAVSYQNDGVEAASVNGAGQYSFTGSGIGGESALIFTGASSASNQLATQQALGIGSAGTAAASSFAPSSHVGSIGVTQHGTATTANPGFLPTLTGSSAHVLLGNGTWGSAGSASIGTDVVTLSGAVTANKIATFVGTNAVIQASGSTVSDLQSMVTTHAALTGTNVHGLGSAGTAASTDFAPSSHVGSVGLTQHGTATTSNPGFLPTLTGNSAHALLGNGTWGVVSSASTATLTFSGTLSTDRILITSGTNGVEADSGYGTSGFLLAANSQTGSIYYSDGTNASKLAIGSTSQVLSVSASGMPAWATISASSGSTGSSGNYIGFDILSLDTGGGGSTPSATGDTFADIQVYGR